MEIFLQNKMVIVKVLAINQSVIIKVLDFTNTGYLCL